MKLIIDIPEKIITAIQNGQDYRYDIHTVIAQGKPYDTTGDLISREALKKALSEPLYRSTIKDFGEVIEYTHIMNTIDNAPTVTPKDRKWFDCIDNKLLKSRYGDYVIYKVDFYSITLQEKFISWKMQEK